MFNFPLAFDKSFILSRVLPKKNGNRTRSNRVNGYMFRCQLGSRDRMLSVPMILHAKVASQSQLNSTKKWAVKIVSNERDDHLEFELTPAPKDAVVDYVGIELHSPESGSMLVGVKMLAPKEPSERGRRRSVARNRFLNSIPEESRRYA